MTERTDGAPVATSPPTRVRREPSSRRLLSPAYLTALIGLGALAVVLRVADLGQSFWYDEVFTAHIAGLPGVSDVIPTVSATETTPPLYYLLTWPWAHLWGAPDEVALRSLSVIFGLAACGLAWVTAYRIRGRIAALWALAFFALDSMLVWFSQEARAYSLMGLCAVGLMHGTVRWLTASDRRGSVTSAAEIGCWMLIAVCTHYAAWFLVVGYVLALLIARRGSVRPLLVAFAPAALAMVALLRYMTNQKGGGFDWFADLPFTERTAQAAKQFLIGLLELGRFDIPVGIPLAVLVLALGCALLWRAARMSRPWNRQQPIVVITLATMTGIALMIVSDRLVQAVIVGRSALAFLPALLVLMAVGAAAPGANGSRKAGTILGAILAVLLGGISTAVAITPAMHRPDWSGALTAVASAPSGQVLVVAPWPQEQVVNHYFPAWRPPSEAETVRSFTVVAGPMNREPAPTLPDTLRVGRATAHLESVRMFTGVTMAKYVLDHPMDLDSHTKAPLDGQFLVTD